MATAPNPTYDPNTGRLKYADGTTVDTKAPARSNASEPTEQANITGRIGCCSKVYSWAIPTDLMRQAFRTGMSPLEVRNHPDVIVTLKGERVDLPVEFTTSHIITAARTAITWGVFPQSPFVRSHAEYMTTEDFEVWLSENPPPYHYEEADVPTANVDQLRTWVNAGVNDDDRLARALIGRDVEEARDPVRSTALSFLNDVIDGIEEGTR